MKSQKISKDNIIIISIAVVFSLGIIIFAIVNNINESKAPGVYDQFAQCLTEKGAIMYGASWCKHCKDQKATFDRSFKYIKYVECPDNTQLCLDKGVQGYPTWLIGTSTRIEGFIKNKTMKDLSDATGCPLP